MGIRPEDLRSREQQERDRRAAGPSPGPAPSRPPTQRQQSAPSAAEAQVAAADQGFGPEVDGYLSRYKKSQFAGYGSPYRGSDDPMTAFRAGERERPTGPEKGYDSDRVADLKRRLWLAGYLTTEQYRRMTARPDSLGLMDAVTLEAVAEMVFDARMNELDPDQYLNQRAANGSPGDMRRRSVYQPEPFMPMNEAEVEQRITNVVRDLLGMDPTPEQLASAKQSFRGGERSAYEQAEAVNREGFMARDAAQAEEPSATGQSVTELPGRTIERPATPEVVARSQLENTPQAEGFKVALLVSRLIGSLRGSL